MKRFSLITTTFCLCACTQTHQRHSIATIDGVEISNTIIDKTIEQQLYDKLYDIYELRHEAADKYLSHKVLDKEAIARHISIDSLISEYISSQMNAENLQSYATLNGLTNGIPVVRDGIYQYLKYESEEGQIEIKQKMKVWLEKQLTDSLKQKYNAKITIEQPITPRLELDSLFFHERGKTDSRIVVTEITDYSCNVCRSMHKALEQLFTDYSDQVCFRYSNFAAEVSYAARAAEAAELQDKYWEMRHALMSEDNYNDSISITNTAIELGLDIDQFYFDISNNDIFTQLNQNNYYLYQKGLYATPTIMINNHIIRGATDIEFLRHEIERALNK